MADFNALQAIINAYIKRNGVQAITGQILNGVLTGMVNALGKGYTVAGAASPTTDPGTMTGPLAYIAYTAGTYTHFDNIVVEQGEVSMLIYNEAEWHKEVLFSLAAQATVDDNIGVPSVGVSFVDGILTFNFRNMKGEPGENGQDGDPAGFGTISASISGGVGTPGVSVQSSGPDTAKNIAFQFTNLKGETGVTSCVVTVDNTTGNPSCAVSLVGQELHLDFSGLKGAQGNTGSSVDYPFTIVNNLTTDDPTQALSAAMGVQLESEVSQLEAKVDGLIVDETTMQPTGNAFVEYNTKVLLSNSNSRYYEFPNIGYEKVSAKVYANSDNYVGIAFYSTPSISAEGFMSSSVRCAGTSSAETFNDVAVPEGCLLIVISNRSALGDAKFSAESKGLEDSVQEVSQKVETLNSQTIPSLQTEIEEKTSVEYPNWRTSSELFTEVGFVRPNGTEGTNSDYRKSDFIGVEKALSFECYGYFTTAISPIAYYDASKNFISAESVSESGFHTIISSVPATAKYFKVSTYKVYLADFTLSARFSIKDRPTKALRVFISPNGNDDNDGLTELSPVKTMGRVKNILSEGGELIMLKGNYEMLSGFDLSSFAKITGYGRVRLIYYHQKITSAEAVSGYTRVYTAPFNGTWSNLLSHRLYIHDLPDADTLILDAERHPLQKGKTYRVPSTMIYMVDSIADVENTTDKLCWCYSDGNLYFSLPENVDLSVNPIIFPSSNNIQGNSKRTIEVRNIEVLYTSIALTNVCGVLDNVSCGMGACSFGQFICDYCSSLLLRNCEAYCAHRYNSSGDGINTHNTDTSISEYSRITIENCWLHDNGDDGESCHENSTSIHYGCLVEYNGNGITPASGGVSECHGCIVRRSGGHLWATDPTGTGFSSQNGVLSCFGCYSADNERGYYTTTDNAAVAYNCIADGNTNDWASKFRQINCTTIS